MRAVAEQMELHFVLIAEDIMDGCQNARRASADSGATAVSSGGKQLKEASVAKSAQGPRTLRS